MLAEIARKYLREGLNEKTLVERLEFIQSLTTIVYVDVETALLTAKAYWRLLEHSKRIGVKSKPSLADAIILAHAWRLKAKVLTGDKHFKDLPETLWLG